MTHRCPITEVETSRCGATTCMWWSAKASTGCMHGLIRRDSVTKADLLQFKAEVPGFTQAKDRIQMAVVLDRYVSMTPVRGSTPVPEEIVARCSQSPLFNKDLFPGLTLETLQHLCLITPFERFAAKLSLKFVLHDVLFLSPEQIDFILSYRSSQ